MMNFNNSKTKQKIAAVIVVVIILAMVVTTILSGIILRYVYAGCTCSA